jgi:hypothetical protein
VQPRSDRVDLTDQAWCFAWRASRAACVLRVGLLIAHCPGVGQKAAWQSTSSPRHLQAANGIHRYFVGWVVGYRNHACSSSVPVGSDGRKRPYRPAHLTSHFWLIRYGASTVFVSFRFWYADVFIRSTGERCRRVAKHAAPCSSARLSVYSHCLQCKVCPVGIHSVRVLARTTRADWCRSLLANSCFRARNVSLVVQISSRASPSMHACYHVYVANCRGRRADRTVAAIALTWRGLVVQRPARPPVARIRTAVHSGNFLWPCFVAMDICMPRRVLKPLCVLVQGSCWLAFVSMRSEVTH